MVSQPMEFPIEFKSIVAAMEKADAILLEPVEMLTGGLSGAYVYRTAVYQADQTLLEGYYILKLTTASSIEWEANRHKQAREQLHPGAAWNLPDLKAYHIDKDSNTGALLYSIAGDSLYVVKPLSKLTTNSDQTQAFQFVNKVLLEDWYRDALRHTESIDSRRLLEIWLDNYSFDSAKLDSLSLFLQATCTYDPERDGVAIRGEILPDPLYHYQHNRLKLEQVSLRVPFAPGHGDLNVNNLLLSFNPRQLGTLEKSFFIDFAFFKPLTPIFFDMAFLELSYLLTRIEKSPNLSLAPDMAAACRMMTDSKTVADDIDTELVGWYQVLMALRAPLDEWLSGRGMRDTYSAIYALAGVAAGLRVAAIDRADPRVRYIAYVYAATHLNNFWRLQGLPMVEESAEFELHGTPKDAYWSSLLSVCRNFNDSQRQFLGILGPMPKEEKLNSLGNIPWSLLFDFDDQAESGTAFRLIGPDLEATGRRIQVMRQPRSDYDFGGSAVSYWLFAEPTNTWASKVSLDIAQMLRKFRQQTPSQVIILVFWENAELLEEILHAIKMGLQSEYQIVFVPSAKTKTLETLAERLKALLYPIRLTTLLEALSTLFQRPQGPAEEYQVPSKDNAYITIPKDTFGWLQEDLEILYKGIGRQDDVDQDAFYRGATISWVDLQLGRSVWRKESDEVLEKLSRDLDDRARTQHNLFHRPGAGGTTVARQVAWKLHERFPVTLLKKTSNIAETVNRLREIYRLSQLSILLVIEASTVDDITLERLFREIHQSRLPFVMLVVDRRGDSRRGELLPPVNERTSVVDALLGPQLGTFIEIYSRVRPERRNELNALTHTRYLQTPFFVGLTAFETEFRRLQDYVSNRLDNLDVPSSHLIQMLALQHFYGDQDAADVRLFKGLFNGTMPNMHRLFSDYQRELLIYEKESWRPSHVLISEEILRQTLIREGFSSEGKAWKNGLINVAKRFIETMVATSGVGNVGYEDINEKLRSLFIKRDWAALSDPIEEGGNQQRFQRQAFSLLILELNEEDRENIFSILCDHFPEDGHFWAHRGRYYYKRDREYEDLRLGIQYCEEAITKDEQDPLLHHMLGMAYKAKIEHDIAYWRNFADEVDKEKEPEIIGEMRHDINQAIKQFERSLELDPNNEHALVTGIKVLLDAIEFARDFIAGEDVSYDEFLAMPRGEEYLEYRNQAHAYSDYLRTLYVGRRENALIITARSRLSNFYGHHEREREGLRKLLSERSAIYVPRVRTAIVRTYYDEVDGETDKLIPHALYDIADLMEKNISEEPNNDNNVRYWFDAARYLPLKYTVQGVIKRLEDWFSRQETLEAAFYLYSLYVLLVLDKQNERQNAEYYMERCKALVKKYRRPRTDYALEMLGESIGLSQLVNHRELDWKDGIPQAEPPRKLRWETGFVHEAQDQSQGGLLNWYKMRIFFVPSLGDGEPPFSQRDEGKPVNFLLGFTYEGMRAYRVKRKKS